MNILCATGKNLEERRNKVFRVIVLGHPYSEIVNDMIRNIAAYIFQFSVADCGGQSCVITLLLLLHNFFLSIHHVWYDVWIEYIHPQDIKISIFEYH
jgi:hypothetical protein